MQQKQFKPVTRPGIIFDERTLQLQGVIGQNPKQSKAGNPIAPNLRIRIKDNKPEIAIYTNDTTDTKNNGMINLLLTVEDLDVMLEFIKEIGLHTETGKDYICEHHARTWTSQGLSEKPFKVATTRIAMDELGVFIQVKVKDRPSPKFYIKTNENFKPGILENGQVRPLTPLEYAKAYASSFARRISNLLHIVLEKNYISWEEQMQQKQERKQQGGFGGGGGNYRPQQQTPAPASPQMDMDDDIPF